MMFQAPPELLEKYDKNGDGQLDENEGRAAQEGIAKRFRELHQEYDANGNGRLDPAEGEKLQADGAAGKLEGIPRMFFRMGGRRGPRGRDRSPSEQRLAEWDKDGDGRLNEEELQRVRAARGKAVRSGEKEQLR
jgi:hypothetical protein